jgi:YidC/Oxa1 family membrane protein insertase
VELWTLWTHALEASLSLLAANFGFSEALTIIMLTLIVRVALLPVSLTSAYRMQRNKEAMERIKPQIEALRKSLQDNPRELAARTMALYREHGVVFIDKLSIVNILTQGVFGIGIFQSLSKMVFSSKFLWISSLAKPDLWLTVLVTSLMLFGMALMPGATHDTSMMLMLAIPVIVSVIAVAALPSALGLYWATSNAVTLVQTLALRGLLARRGPVGV